MSQQNNGDPMPYSLPPRASRFEWNFNTIVTVVGLIVSFGGSMSALGIAYNSITSKQDIMQTQISEEKIVREKRGVQTDARFTAIEQKIPQFEVIALQIQRLTELAGQNAKAIEATNDRIQRVVDSQTGKLDAIITSVSTLTTEVRVIQSQIKNQDRSERTRFPTPAMRP